MARRKKSLLPDPFIRIPYMTTDEGKMVSRGDIIKIKGTWGLKFKFWDLVENPANGKVWVDCFELQKNGTDRVEVAAAWRSFYPDKVKAIHIPKKRVTRVTGTNASRSPRRSKSGSN